MFTLKRRLTLAVMVVAVCLVSFGEAMAYPPSVDAYAYGNNSGPVEGFGLACSSYGSLDYMWMTLQGPSSTEEWQWQAPYPGGGGGCQQHTLTSAFQYDSDYFVTVFACSTDDGGYDCTSDTKSFRTPPRQPGDPDPPGGGGFQACYTGPCPFIYGVSPQPVYLGDSGTLTVTGVNLENVQAVYFAADPGNSWGGGPDISASIVSATTDTVTISYYVPYNPSLFIYHHIVLCDGGNPQPNCTSAYPFTDAYPFSVSQH